MLKEDGPGADAILMNGLGFGQVFARTVGSMTCSGLAGALGSGIAPLGR